MYARNKWCNLVSKHGQKHQRFYEIGFPDIVGNLVKKKEHKQLMMIIMIMMIIKFSNGKLCICVYSIVFKFIHKYFYTHIYLLNKYVNIYGYKNILIFNLDIFKIKF